VDTAHNTRSPDRRAVTLAERACGETDRLDPPGMPRSYRRLRRCPSAPDPCGLHRLLRTPNAPDPGQGFAGSSFYSAVWPDHSATDPRRTSSRILPDVACGRNRCPLPWLRWTWSASLITRSRRESHWGNGITPAIGLQRTFATVSARNGRSTGATTSWSARLLSWTASVPGSAPP
jgi:hypothetical protein